MLPEAKHENLLYVSDVATDDVNVYSYSAGKLVGQLTGFDEPQGECVDYSGNVYVANTLASNIIEYAHGGTEPTATLNDPGQYPVDCVFETGGIALTNITTTSGGPESVSFYYDGRIQGTFVDPAISNMYYIGHQGKVQGGEFFVDGINADTGKFEFAKFADTRFTELSLKEAIAAPGAIQWWQRGRFIGIGDQAGDIYEAHGPKIYKTLTLDGACAVGQFSISKSKIVAPDPCNANVGIYLKTGGSPIKVIKKSLHEPVGTALSLRG